MSLVAALGRSRALVRASISASACRLVSQKVAIDPAIVSSASKAASPPI